MSGTSETDPALLGSARGLSFHGQRISRVAAIVRHRSLAENCDCQQFRSTCRLAVHARSTTFLKTRYAPAPLATEGSSRLQGCKFRPQETHPVGPVLRLVLPAPPPAPSSVSLRLHGVCSHVTRACMGCRFSLAPLVGHAEPVYRSTLLRNWFGAVQRRQSAVRV
jgi:hypothetical protein